MFYSDVVTSTASAACARQKRYRLLSRSLIALLLLLSVSVLSSCDSDDYDEYYYSPLIGGWQLYSVNGFIVDEPDVTTFRFYDNGTGIYGQYTSFPNWSEYQFTWDCDFPNPSTSMLYINMWDGQMWAYRFSVGYGQLTLWDTLNGNTLVFTPY